jgi:hypothetical protein
MDRSRTELAEALTGAHADLLRDLRELEQIASENQMGTDEEVIGVLLRARSHIGEHFRFEEEDGYLNWVQARKPHLAPTIKVLLEDHFCLAHLLDQLIEDARAGMDRAELNGRVRGWLAALRRHESRENGLVQDVFNVDESAED